MPDLERPAEIDALAREYWLSATKAEIKKFVMNAGVNGSACGAPPPASAMKNNRNGTDKPSLRPASTFSAWRIFIGTRGLSAVGNVLVGSATVVEKTEQEKPGEQ